MINLVITIDINLIIKWFFGGLRRLEADDRMMVC